MAAVAPGDSPRCGYALVGKGTVTDPSIKRIGVPTFKDTTGKPALDQKITQKVIEELLKRGRFDVVQADRRAWMRWWRASSSPTPWCPSASATSGRREQPDAGQSATPSRSPARVKYSKVGRTEPIWSNDSFSFRDEYDVGADPATFFDREDQALDRLATSFARSLVAAMLEAF